MPASTEFTTSSEELASAMKIDKIYSATSRIGSQLTTQHLAFQDCSKLLKVYVHVGQIRCYESLLTQLQPHTKAVQEGRS
jgi:hypothetical protein